MILLHLFCYECECMSGYEIVDGDVEYGWFESLEIEFVFYDLFYMLFISTLNHFKYQIILFNFRRQTVFRVYFLFGWCVGSQNI